MTLDELQEATVESSSIQFPSEISLHYNNYKIHNITVLTIMTDYHHHSIWGIEIISMMSKLQYN